jgi:hypothetical protein
MNALHFYSGISSGNFCAKRVCSHNLGIQASALRQRPVSAFRIMPCFLPVGVAESLEIARRPMHVQAKRW